MIGKTLAGYRVVEQIGQGGMATVYKAFDPATERHVAIKTLPEHYSHDESFRARFKQEAKAIAQLEHIHIVPMFAYGEEDGIAYMIMRYLATGTLADYLHTQGALSFDLASNLLAQIASALDYAHTHDILHRDVKPSNILIDNQNNALLTDFGIAKIIGDGGLDLTGTGLIGTPKYMSPEQCRGEKMLTPAADQYALGIILYEMVTGAAPFDAETPLAVIQQHVSAPLPLPRQRRPDLPEAAQNAILKALAREPQSRYSTCQDFAKAFQDALGSAGEATTRLDVASIDDTEPTLVPDDDTTIPENNTPPAHVFVEKPRPVPSRFTLPILSPLHWVALFAILCGLGVAGILVTTEDMLQSSDSKPDFLATDTLTEPASTLAPNPTDSAHVDEALTQYEFGDMLFDNNWTVIVDQDIEDETHGWTISPDETQIEGAALADTNLVAYLGDTALNDTYLRIELLPRKALESGSLVYLHADAETCQRYEIRYELLTEETGELSVWRITNCEIPEEQNLGSMLIPNIRQYFWYHLEIYSFADNLVVSIQSANRPDDPPYQQLFPDDASLEMGLVALVVPPDETLWYRIVSQHQITPLLEDEE